jgi:hypothetical protein
MRKPVPRLSEQTGLPSHQTGLQADLPGLQADLPGLQADLPGLGFDLHPNPSPSPNKPVGAGASPFGKPKSELSYAAIVLAQTVPLPQVHSTSNKSDMVCGTPPLSFQ